MARGGAGRSRGASLVACATRRLAPTLTAVAYRVSALAWPASWITFALLAASGTLACSDHGSAPGGTTSSRASPPTPGPRDPTEIPSPPSDAPRRETIPCTTDSDCPALACGPCDAGKVLTTDLPQLQVECYRNPCRFGGSYCNPQRLCAVNPKAEWDPAVRGRDQVLDGGKPGNPCNCRPGDPMCEIVCEEQKRGK
jgi:hypothetical protein